MEKIAFRVALGMMTAIMAAPVMQAEEVEPLNIFKPEISVYGMIRTRAEVSTREGDVRFGVRTGRVGVMGNISKAVSYKAELDLCDKGKVKVTDVWARVKLGRGFAVQAGQMRMPFTFGSARAPHSYLFADRPFVDKQILGPRNSGVKGIYNCPTLPLTVEGGVFNSTSLTDHSVWQSDLSYAAKALWKQDNVTFLAGFESLHPSHTRINHTDVGVCWTGGRWMVEGEYVYKHYTNSRLNATHGYNIMADYAMPLHMENWNKLSFQARLDGMNDNSNGQWVDQDGNSGIMVTDPGRDRITVGSTLSYRMPKVWADIKLNYQHYFYHRQRTSIDLSADNMVTAELVVRF